MLLARGERQHKAAVAIGINGFAANPTRHLPHKLLTASKETYMRAAKGKADAETLAFADNNIRALCAGRFNRGQGNRFRKDRNEQRFMRMGFFGNGTQVDNLACLLYTSPSPRD